VASEVDNLGDCTKNSGESLLLPVSLRSYPVNLKHSGSSRWGKEAGAAFVVEAIVPSVEILAVFLTVPTWYHDRTS